MSEDLKQTACLYVLGMLPEHEAAAFEQEIAADAGLQKLVGSLNNALLAIARSTAQKQPPAALRARILDSLAPGKPATPAPAEPVLLPEIEPERETRRPRGVIVWLPWAAAAALAITAAYTWRNWQSESGALRDEKTRAAQLAQELKTAAEREAGLDNRINQLIRESAEMRTAGEEQVKQAKDELAAAQQRMTELEKAARVDQARVALLTSIVKDRPKAVAVSVWNQAQQDGILVVENLPVLPAGRDYQLWVIDPNAGAPVSAGVFKVDTQGRVRIQFKPDKNIQQADKFAITEEKEGGVPAPTMAKMVVIGG